MSLSRKPNQSSGRSLTPRKSIIALSGILLVLLVPGVTGCGKQLNQLGAALTATVLANEAALPVYRFVPGQRLIYKLDYTNTSASDLRVLFEGLETPNTKETAAPSSFVNSFETTVQSELVATVLDKKADSVLISYSLRQPVVHLKSSGQEATAQTEIIKTDLSREIFATVNSQGRVLSVRFDPAVGDLSKNFVRTLLSVTQFVVPGSQSADSRQWTTQEDDPNGQYLARYQAKPGFGKPADIRTFEKTKVRYLQLPSGKTKPDDSQLPTIIKPEGKLMADFDLRRGHLVSLTGKELQDIAISGKNVGRAETTLHMTYLDQVVINSSELAAMRDASNARQKVATAVPLSVMPSEAETEAAIQRQELGTATLESLRADLAKLEASTNETKDATSLYLKFKALVYLHPESSASLGKILATADAKSVTMGLLTGSLGAVGHAEAQAALVNAIQARSQDWTALSMLIPALASVSLPTQITEDTLRNLAFQAADERIASTAQLALGTVARNLVESSPERSGKIVDRIIKDINSSPSEGVTKQLLLVLGNAGTVRALPTITRFTTAPSPDVRATAASALRWINSSQVDTLLTKALTSDSDDTVRLEAAAALGFREMNTATFEAQKKAFLTDKAVKVRLTTLKNLWQAHKAFAEVRRLVKQAAEKDASIDVREAAANIIAMYPNGYFKD